MKVEIIKRPGNAAAKVTLGAGETITSEGGAMIAMSSDMSIETTTHKKGKGSILKAIKRMFAGENFFINHFTPGPSGGDIYLAPVLSGDLMTYDLKDEKIIIQADSFLACEHDLDFEVSFEGAKNFFSGESLFWINLSGTGKAVFNAFGAIYPVEIDGEYIVDTGHIVAFQETLSYTLSKAGKSWMSSFMGSEGIICKFSGVGTVWCQSHNDRDFGKTFGRMLKPRQG